MDMINGSGFNNKVFVVTGGTRDSAQRLPVCW
jgi:hypothetical protein